MRVGVGAILQTSNSFSATKTKLDHFQQHRLVSGRELGELGFQDPVCLAITQELANRGSQVIPLIEASAPAGGPLDESAVGGIREKLSEGLEQAGEIDRIVLHVSGSMLHEEHEPAELMLIKQLKTRLRTEVPIRIVLDTHANVDPRLHKSVELVTCTFGPQFREAEGERSSYLDALMDDPAYPPLYTRQLGPLFLTPLPKQDAASNAMNRIEQHRRSLAASDGVVGAHVAYGFPYADTRQTGVSVWATATSQSRADEAADKLREMVERERSALSQVDYRLNTEEAVHAAMASPETPSILLDTGDDPAGGAPGDGTGLLWALLDLGARDAILAPMVDPPAVELAYRAGKGQSVEMEVGAQIDRRHGYPVNVRGTVVRLAERVPGYDAGRVALVQAEGRHAGSVLIVLTERRINVDDLGILDALGIDLDRLPIVSLKASLPPSIGAVGLRAVANIMLVATPGITVPDFSYFPFERLAPGVLPEKARVS